MKIYSDQLKEAREPPEVEIEGVVHVGRLLSYEEFLNHEEELSLVSDVDNPSTGDIRAQFQVIRKYLEDVFPRPSVSDKPEQPKPPRFYEKIWYVITGKDPKRWHEYVEKLTAWEDEVEETNRRWAPNVIMQQSDMLDIVNRLFTYQRGTLRIQVTPMNEQQSSQDS